MRLTKRLLLSFFMLFAASVSVAYGAGSERDFEQAYGQLLERYWRPAVTINGVRTTVFDYSKMAEDHIRKNSLVDKVVEALRKVDPGGLSGDAEKAFWINAYNFGAMRLVIDHYPVDSIRSLKISLIKYPWSKDAVEVAGNSYTLKQIEKDILLPKLNDPRIVFAVSCAAVSCPDRTPEPFTAGRLDAQLDEMIRVFLANPKKGLQADREKNKLILSWIFDKDRQLFVDRPGGVIGFVRRYVPRPLAEWLSNDKQIHIDYFHHDWTLNDLAQADR